MRANLDRALAFAGLAATASGELDEVEQVHTLTEARHRAAELRADLEIPKVHPDVLRFCREELLVDNYFHAVLETTKSVADKLRTGVAKRRRRGCGLKCRLRAQTFPRQR